MNISVGFLGAGQMAQALCKGFLKAGIVNASNIWASGIGDENLNIISKNGINVSKDNTEVVSQCRVIILAVKPYVAMSVLRQIKEFVNEQHLIVSVAAGITIQQIQDLLPESRIIRVALNTPVAVLSAVSVFCAGSHAISDDIETVRKMMSSVGSCFVMDEKHLDTVTALAGSGPAYVFLAIESLADGGVKMGLPRDVALKISAETVMGSAKLLLESGKHPGQLKDSICSPGGCTIAGIHELEKAGFRGSLISAIETGTLVARQLGKNS